MVATSSRNQLAMAMDFFCWFRFLFLLYYVFMRVWLCVMLFLFIFLFFFLVWCISLMCHITFGWCKQGLYTMSRLNLNYWIFESMKINCIYRCSDVEYKIVRLQYINSLSMFCFFFPQWTVGSYLYLFNWKLFLVKLSNQLNKVRVHLAN